MNTSTNKDDAKPSGGAFADGLTLIRVLMTPLVMYLIIAHGWPDISVALFISMLFAIAALTDLFDDMIGGAETSRYRKFGWFDDIADIVLICGTLIAMLIVKMNTNMSEIVILNNQVSIPETKPDLLFIIPAIIIISREVIIGLLKGFEFSSSGWPESPIGDLKNAIIMLATCVLLASPWLTALLMGLSASGVSLEEAKNNSETLTPEVFNPYVEMPDIVWAAGSVLLLIGAVLSLVSAYHILTKKSQAANDG